MTWPFENDTSAIIKNLAKKNLKADKSRNILLIIAIAFATCLIMATTLYFFGTRRASLNEANGLYQATVTDLTEEDVLMLQKDKRVQTGMSYLVGMVSYGDYKLTVRTIDENLISVAKYPEMQGTLPGTGNEIAITQAFLSKAGLDVTIGDTISLDLGKGKKEFQICGILPVKGTNYSLYVSEEYVKNLDPPPLCSAYVRLINSEGWSKDAIKNELSAIVEEWGLKQGQLELSTYYFSLIEQRGFQYLTVITTISLIVALACALVIYSLFFVSIIKKTNEYGKLRTIGTTGRQIKRIVFKEGRHLSQIAIPIGILSGGVAGFFLAPIGWDIATAFLIAIISGLLVYVCVMLSIIKPARIASCVTPIEAIRFASINSVTSKATTNKLHRPLSAVRLAKLNFSREKKKAVLTIVSLGICGTLLMASSAYFNSIDPSNMARRSFPYGEIRVELGDYGPQAHNSEQFYNLQKRNLLTNHIINGVLNIDGVNAVKEYKGSVLSVTLPTGDQEPLVADAFTSEEQSLIENYLIEGTADLHELIQNNGIVLAGGNQWKDIFGWDIREGDELTLNAGSGNSIEVKVMGIVHADIPYGGYNTLFIPLEILSSFVPLDNLTYQFIVDTDKDSWRSVKEQIQGLFPATANVYISTFDDWVQSFEEKLLNYRMPVYIFIMLIGVFGVINLLNTLITNMLTRKREFGILQAVGLNHRQLEKILLTEGLFYTIAVFAVSIVLGTVAGILLCRVFSAMSVFGVVTYHFPVLEMTGYFVLMLVVQMSFSYSTIKQLQKQTLVEQIKEL